MSVNEWIIDRLTIYRNTYNYLLFIMGCFIKHIFPTTSHQHPCCHFSICGVGRTDPVNNPAESIFNLFRHVPYLFFWLFLSDGMTPAAHKTPGRPLDVRLGDSWHPKNIRRASGKKPSEVRRAFIGFFSFNIKILLYN